MYPLLTISDSWIYSESILGYKSEAKDLLIILRQHEPVTVTVTEQDGNAIRTTGNSIKGLSVAFSLHDVETMAAI